MKRLSTIVFLTTIILGCANPKNENVAEQSKTENSEMLSNYSIVDEIKSETSSKAQLIEYAVYEDTVYTKEALENTVTQIYELNKNKNIFKTHEFANTLAVYLFTSKEAFKDKSNWIAMLIKRPNETTPYVTFNEFKINALGKSKDIKSKDEVELEKLTSYLEKKGLNLCTLADLLKKTELENIHKADAKYPDYGDRHMAMIDQLDAQSYRLIRKKYNLSEDMLSKVSVFAMSYCK